MRARSRLDIIVSNAMTYTPKATIGIVRILVAITALVYLGVSLWSGWADVVAAVKQVGVLGIAVGCLLMSANDILRFMRWSYYLKLLELKVPPADSFRIFLASIAVTITPGGAGEPVVRGLFLKRYGATFPQIFAAYGAERILDVMCVFMLTLFGLLAYRPAHLTVGIMAGLVLLAFLIFRQEAWLTRLRTFVQGKWGRAGRIAAHGVDVILHSHRFFVPSVLA